MRQQGLLPLLTFAVPQLPLRCISSPTSCNQHRFRPSYLHWQMQVPPKGLVQITSRSTCFIPFGLPRSSAQLRHRGTLCSSWAFQMNLQKVKNFVENFDPLRNHVKIWELTPIHHRSSSREYQGCS